MSIPIEPSPSSIPPDAAEYLQRMFINIAATFEERDALIADLEEYIKSLETRVKALESKP